MEQTILEKWHNITEVGSDHSTLQIHFKPPIYTQDYYIMKTEKARHGSQNKHPYTVRHFDHILLQDYENLPNNYHCLSAGKIPEDSTVAEIRGLK